MSGQTNHQSEEIRSTHRAFTAARESHAESLWQGESTEPLSPLLLGAHNIGGRGNSPTRAASIQSLQQTHGNCAVQRFVQRQAAPVTPVQRESDEEKSWW